MYKNPTFLLFLLIGVTWAVPTTEDGVPILDESYFERHDRPASKFFSQFEGNRNERRGLAVFDGLDENGGNPFLTPNRPQLRSLDGGGASDDLLNGFQEAESSKVRKTFSRRRSSKSVRVKSIDSSTSEPVVTATIPRFSEEVVYRRSNNLRARQTNQNQLRSLHSSSSNAASNYGQSSTSNHCTRCRQMYSATNGGGTRARSQNQLRSLDTSSASSSASTSSTSKRETEGLRLYNKLIDEGRAARSRGFSQSQNQLRSLDTSSNDWDYQPAPRQPVIQAPAYTHHRRHEESRHEESSASSSSSILESSGSPVLATTPPTNVHYHVSTGGGASETRRATSSSSNSNRLRSLPSSLTGSYRNNGGLGGCTSYVCRMRSQSTSTMVGPDDNLGLSYPAASGAASTSHWAEKEERSHSSRRTISHKVNGVETNGLGEPYVSEEEANYRREEASSGGAGNAEVTRTTSNNNQLRSLQTSSLAIEREAQQEASQAHHQQTRVAPTPAPTLSVGNGQRRRRYNCTQVISTSSLSEGAESVADIVRPPPCLVQQQTRSSRSSSHQNQLERRSSDIDAMPYPPVQTLGQTGGEVEARVLHSDNEDEERQEGSQRIQQTGYSTGRKHKKAYFRRTTFKNYTTSEFPPSFAETIILNN